MPVHIIMFLLSNLNRAHLELIFLSDLAAIFGRFHKTTDRWIIPCAETTLQVFPEEL
jgi:hypothetical protein